MEKIINIDKEIMGGTPVFMGTRVPIYSLFDHLESGISIDEFLEDFPSVKKEQAVNVVTIAGKLISSLSPVVQYENIIG